MYGVVMEVSEKTRTEILKRERLKKKMRLLKEKCIGCALCTSLYPDLFEIGKDGHANIKEGVIPDEEKLKEVIRSCPVQAIKLIEEKKNKF